MPQPKDQPVDELRRYANRIRDAYTLTEAEGLLQGFIQAECNRARIDELKGLPSKYPLGNVMGSDIERRVVQLQQIMKEGE